MTSSRSIYPLSLILFLAFAVGCSKEKGETATEATSAAASSPSALVSVTESSFESEVLGADRPVLAVFSASWCKHCAELRGLLTELAGKSAYKGKVKVATIDIDEVPGLATRFGVSTVPAVFGFISGEEAGGFVGVRESGELEALFAALAGPEVSKVSATAALAELAAKKSDASGCEIPADGAAEGATCPAP